MSTVLILDDEPVIREVLGSVLAKAGFVTREAASAAEGLERLAKESIDLLLLDLMLPDRPGLEVLAEVKARHPEVPVVVVTAYSSVESAISAMREGAFHYLPKPFRNEEVVHVVKQALEKRRLVAENRALKARLDAPPGGRLALDDPHHRRERNRQGARREGAPPAVSEGVGPVRHRAFRGAPARPSRVEPLRTRPGLVHWRGRRQEGPVQGGRPGHDLLRRDRHGPSRDAGEAPARPAGARIPARGRDRAAARRRARHRGHERRSRPARGRGALPRGPLLPPLRHHDSSSPAARAPRGRAASRGDAPRASRGRERQGRPLRHARHDEGAPRPRLARQRARARERPRARPCLLYTSPSPRDRTRS